jgi:predicted metalloprotease with PDZ domain
VDANGFYLLTGDKISEVEALSPTALEDASLSTWIHPRDGTADIYYPKGSLAGLLLDIMIRDASDNHSSLDDVMRTLYNAAYKNGRGFTSDEWWSTVSKAAKGRSFSDFYGRYIDGREPFPYDKALPLAGLRLARDTAHVPQLGIASVQDSSGLHVTQVIPESSAAAAGVQPGDQLISVGGFNADDPNWTEKFRSRYARLPEGTELPVVVRRAGAEQTLTARLHFVTSVGSRLIEDARASAKARRVREGLLRGITQP